jgi:serine/threonine protein kinase
MQAAAASEKYIKGRCRPRSSPPNAPLIAHSIDRRTGQLVISEISILSNMHSPYVTKYYGSYLHNTELWIVMEFCSGGSCADLMRPGPIDESEIAVILKELLMGLCYLHEDHKLHRDIKGELGKLKLRVHF